MYPTPSWRWVSLGKRGRRGRTTLTYPGQNPGDYHLDPFDAATHQDGTSEQYRRADDERPLPPERLGGERCRKCAGNRANVIQRSDRADHDSAGITHLVEPVFGDDDAGHDTLVVAEETEASRADRGEHRDECSPAQAVHAQLRREYCHVATRRVFATEKSRELQRCRGTGRELSGGSPAAMLLYIWAKLGATLRKVALTQ